METGAAAYVGAAIFGNTWLILELPQQVTLLFAKRIAAIQTLHKIFTASLCAGP
jgi:hypothetical protein